MKILLCSKCKKVPLVEIKEDVNVHFKIYCSCSTSDISATKLYSSFVSYQIEKIDSKRCEKHNNSMCYCILCKVHFCNECNDTHKEHQTVKLDNLKISVDVEKKRKELETLIKNVNDLFNTMKDEYKKEINSKELLFVYVKKYLKFNIIFTVIKMIFNTFITLNNDKSSNYPSIINVLNNTHYIIDNNTKYHMLFKLKFSNDIHNYITKLRLLKSVNSLNYYLPMKVMNSQLSISIISLLDESTLMIVDERGCIYHAKLDPFLQNYEKKHETNFIIKKIYALSNGNKFAVVTNPGQFLILKYINGKYQQNTYVTRDPITIVSALGLWDDLVLILYLNGRAILFNYKTNRNILFKNLSKSTGNESYYLLKDNTIVFFSGKGYVSFLQYKEDPTQNPQSQYYYRFFLEKMYYGILLIGESFYESESQKRLYIGCQVSKGVNAITVINLVTRRREYTYIDDFFMKVTDKKQLQTFTFLETKNGNLLITTPNGFILYMEQKNYKILGYKYCGRIEKSFINSTKTKLILLSKKNN